MARTAAELPPGPRITDYISLGVIAKAFPRATVDAVLRETGRSSERQRDLPAHVMMYYVIALALFMRSSYREVLRCLLEGVQWLLGPETELRVAGRSGISQARSRLGSEPVRRLHDEVVKPVAGKSTRGAWYRGWKLVSLDGSTMAVADTEENEREFGRPGQSRGKAAYPLIRFVSLVENGTHVLFGTCMDAYRKSEVSIAASVLSHLKKGMLCLADRCFYSFERFQEARKTKGDLLWRTKTNLVVPCHQQLPDGSYLTKIYASESDRRHDRDGAIVRIVEYTLEGIPDADPLYRLMTTILDHRKAPARELAALYHERWEIETALDELKTHLRGAGIVLRSKKPDLVKQEFYGFLMAHFAIRALMHEAALQIDEDPDSLSFIHAVNVVRRKLLALVASPPSPEESVP